MKKTVNVLYVYGWGSNAKSRTADLFADNFPANYKVHTVQYNQNNGTEAIDTIRKYVNDNHIDIVIGTSLGGFLTLMVHGVPRIIVNPCMYPSVELPKIGVPQEIADTYKFLENGIKNNDLEDNTIVLGVFADNDELLGQKYVPVFNKYYGWTKFIKGGHRLDNDNVKELVDYITTDFDKRMKQLDNYYYNCDSIAF